MKVGTRSVLYGYHCLALHWVFVALGWWQLHKWRRVRVGTRTHLRKVDRKIVPINRAEFTSLLDYRLWLAFLVHDLGYWRSPNMDGPEGERHPEVGARFMRRRFGEPWGQFCLYHSRFYAKRDGAAPSALCYADKLAFCKYPTWLIVLLVSWSGEGKEYMANAARDNEGLRALTVHDWAEGVKRYVRQWVAQHSEGAPDTATPVREHL